jgi:formyltetrahydrofolate synthetase
LGNRPGPPSFLRWESETPVPTEVEIARAGFLVVPTGEVLRIPGGPRASPAESIDLDGWTIAGME